MKTRYNLPLSLPDDISNEAIISCYDDYDTAASDVIRFLELLSSTKTQKHHIRIADTGILSLWSPVTSLYDDSIEKRGLSDVHRAELKMRYERLIERSLFGDL